VDHSLWTSNKRTIGSSTDIIELLSYIAPPLCGLIAGTKAASHVTADLHPASGVPPTVYSIQAFD